MHQSMQKADESVMEYIRVHANLLRTILMLGLCIWGVWEHHFSIVTGIIVTGAISYYIGFLVSLIVCISWSAAIAFTEATISGSIATLMISLVGLSCVAWLGFQHKETAELEQSKESTKRHPSHPHTDQVLPWAVANDVRTSLAAIRFLLFPIHEEKRLDELEIASRELSRLEQVFKEIEEKANQ